MNRSKNIIFNNLKTILIALFASFKLNAQAPEKKLLIQELEPHVYVYTTWGDAGGFQFPANGMYVLTESGAALIDTPWDSTQFQPLLDSIYFKHGKKVIACIATHFHDDRTAGLSYYSSLGIDTYTSCQTKQLCLEHHSPIAENCFHSDTTFQFDKLKLQTFYPGKGHTPDNIIVYLPNDGIVYGGCFIKSIDTQNIGNLSDAEPETWYHSLEKVETKYPDPKWIIPGHQGFYRGKAAYDHSKKILKKHMKKSKRRK